LTKLFQNKKGDVFLGHSVDDTAKFSLVFEQLSYWCLNLDDNRQLRYLALLTSPICLLRSWY